MNLEKLEKIYVVGFPKSGNTWLTRLLADVLSCPAGAGMKDKDSIEVATDSNNIILKENPNPKYKIVKSHYLPDDLMEIKNNKDKKIVYIIRDFRDILVSAFFFAQNSYKYYEENEIKILSIIKTLLVNPKTALKNTRNRLLFIKDEDLKLKKIKRLILSGPIKNYKYIRARYLFNKYVHRISRQYNEIFGSWGQHADAWHKYKNNKDLTVCFTAYENLLDNTENEIKKIIRCLGMSLPPQDKIIKSIKRQSFAEKRKYLENIDNSNNIPHGKKFNLSFLRKGKSGDWINFFTKKNAYHVNNFQGEALVRYGYEKNISWWKKY